MQGRIRFAILGLALCTISAAAAGEAKPTKELEQALKAVATYEYGKDFAPLRRTEELVFEAAKDAKQHAEAEALLLGALQAAKTTDAKSFLCRQLRTIGTERAIPALAAMLADAKLSHMARYALGRIEGEAAAAALRKALGKTSGKLQAGIIGTLGSRRDRPSVPALAKLLKAPDAVAAEAAAGALGRIGGTDAAKALEGVRAKASARFGERVNDALLACADHYLGEGNKTAAARIYESFYSPKEAKHVRIAALRGLVAARGAEAAALLMAAIKSGDRELRASAIGFVETVKGTEATKAFAALLPSLSPEAQELLLRSLGARGDPAARPAVVAATKSEHEAVRVAALSALGNVGDASAVGLLAQAAATKGGGEQTAARTSLGRLRGADVNRVMIQAMRSGDAKLRVELIRALAGRRATEAVTPLFQTARDADSTVRREAIRALGGLVGEEQLATLIGLAVRPKEARDREAVEQAILAAFRRMKDREKQAAPVLAALGTAPAEAKSALVRILGKIPTAKALDAVRAAAKDANGAVKDAAVRALSQWHDATPAEELLTLARTSPNQTHKVLALRGYVRMAGMSQNPTQMYLRAMKLAQRPEDKKLVLGGLATADTPEALKLAEQYLADEQLKGEAAVAVIQIADKLRQKDATRATAALSNVLAVVKDPAIRKQAQDVMNEMEKYQGYILAWMGAGPYRQKGKDARALFDIAFPPEKQDAGDVKWKRLTRGIGSWSINLEAALATGDVCAGYVRTRVWSPEEQPVRLELGSDDAIKAWLNGKVVHENNTDRGVGPAQDKVNVKLQKGWNDILLKIVENQGGWGFCCRIRKPDGSALGGLKVEAK